MARRWMIGVVALLGATSGPGLAVSASGQQPCRPPALHASAQPNIFTEAQENDLGDAVAERVQRSFRVIDDAEVTGGLHRIGERLVSHLPPSHLHFQFVLVDLPDANAFVLPGGRIYVSRKLVGFTQSEDELAGVLGHEMGHLIARQQTIAVSRQFRDVIGVTEVGDRRDIVEKYNRLMDNAALKPDAFRRGNIEDDQIEADQIGLFALAAAGYDPLALARFFDRLADTKGRTGSFFADLFGAANPDVKRLRELVRSAAALPAGCADGGPAPQSAGYEAWQAAVISYTGLGQTEVLHGVVSKTALHAPITSDLDHLKFSQDGRYILAQDHSGISVLSREPFEPLFRIDAPDAGPAQFTPDSKDVLFHTMDLRVEVWNVASRKLKDAREVVLRKTCLQAELAPDGKTIACLDPAFGLGLFDVASGAPIYQKPRLFTPGYADSVVMRSAAETGETERSGDRATLAFMSFSSDSRFFGVSHLTAAVVPGRLAERVAIVYDQRDHVAIDLKDDVRDLMANGFAFTGADRLVALNALRPTKSVRVALPSGDVVEELTLPRGRFEAATAGNIVFVRPYLKYTVGIIDLKAKVAIKFARGDVGGAIDVHGDVFVAERGTGELGLYAMDGNRLLAAAVLPPGPLAGLYARAVSPDFKWVAVSERSRGSVWNVATGDLVIPMRGFSGGYFCDDGSLFFDLPRADDDPRRIVKLDPMSREVTRVADIKDDHLYQFGAFLLSRTAASKTGDISQGLVMEMRDALNARLLWRRTFGREQPDGWVDGRSGTLVLAWRASSPAVRDEIRASASLSRRFAAMKNPDDDYFLQICDARTGDERASLLVETNKGSFRLERASAFGGVVLLSDSENRVQVYSLATGEQQGVVFGGGAAVARATGLLLVENGQGRLTIYELTTLQKRDEFVFAHSISLATFSPDGQRLFVLTSDQTAYVLDVRNTLSPP